MLINTSSNISIKKRKIIIFIISVNILGCITMFLATRTWVNVLLQQVMAGLFLFSPFLVALVIRVLGKEAWNSSGLNFNFKESKKWYLFSILIFPLMIVLNLLIAYVLNKFRIDEGLIHSMPQIFRTTLILFVPMVVKNIGEEFGWRGYLEPQLKGIGVSPFKRHIITGVVWAVWHLPVIFLTEYTQESLLTFLPRFFVGTIIFAFVYGQLRDYSNTVWTSILLHAMGNALGNTMIVSSSLAAHSFIGIAPQSFVFMICWLALSGSLWKINQKSDNKMVSL